MISHCNNRVQARSRLVIPSLDGFCPIYFSPKTCGKEPYKILGVVDVEGYINYATCGVEWNAAQAKARGLEPLLQAQEASFRSKRGGLPHAVSKGSELGRTKIARRRTGVTDRDLEWRLGPVPRESSAEEPSVSSVASGGLAFCSLGGAVTTASQA